MALKKTIATKYKLVTAGPVERHLAMFKGKEEEAKPVVKWALDTLKKNDRVVWFLKNYRKDPSIWNDDTKVKLEHFMSMTSQLADLDKLVFDAKWSLEEGLEKLSETESKCLCSLKDRRVGLPQKGKKVLDLGGGWAWWDLQTSSDPEEGAAMGHCGNTGVPDSKDTILSLREEVLSGKESLYAPHLTFILNDGVLGEMKGKANEKPKQKYHKHIIELLKSPLVDHIWGGGYAAHKNFSISDLSKEEQYLLLEKKPDLDLTRLRPVPNHKVDSHKKHGGDFLRHNQAIGRIRTFIGEKAAQEYRQKNNVKVDDELDYIMSGKADDEMKYVEDVHAKGISADNVIEWIRHAQDNADKARKKNNTTNPNVLYPTETYVTALRHVTDQNVLREHLIPPNKYPVSFQTAAIHNLTDQKTLKECVDKKTNLDIDVRLHCLYKIEDKGLLRTIAEDTSDKAHIRAAALDKLNDAALMRKILKQDDGYETIISQIVFKKLDSNEVVETIVDSETTAKARIYGLGQTTPEQREDIFLKLAKQVGTKTEDANVFQFLVETYIHPSVLDDHWGDLSDTAKRLAGGSTGRWSSMPETLARKLATDTNVMEWHRINALRMWKIPLDDMKDIFKKLETNALKMAAIDSLYVGGGGDYYENAHDFLRSIARGKDDDGVRLRAALRTSDEDLVAETLKTYKAPESALYISERDELKKAFRILQDKLLPRNVIAVYESLEDWAKAYMRGMVAKSVAEEQDVELLLTFTKEADDRHTVLEIEDASNLLKNADDQETVLDAVQRRREELS